MEPLLTVSSLGVRLRGKDVLEGLSFELLRAETLVILGPNGAGKTVLLRALLGLVPRAGTVRWESGVSAGYVPQRLVVAPDLPVTVEDFFELQGLSREAAPAALALVGLKEPSLARDRLGHLSSGQFQRVLIASALARRPDVLLCDEPTAGIDVKGEQTIYELLQEHQQRTGMAIILVTHDLSVVYGHATRALCINKKPYCYGAPRDVLTPDNLEALYGAGVRFVRHVHE